MTTTADVVSGGDGQTSLREAFIEAGSNGVDDTIALGAGLTYTLSNCPAGALAHPDGHQLVVQGNGSTIDQSCDATGIIDSTNHAGRLELLDLVIDGGPNTTATALEGAAVRSDSELKLSQVEIRNVLSPGGSVVWSSFDHGTVPYRMTVRFSNLHHNTGSVVSCDNCSLEMFSTTISDNTGSGLSLVDGYPVMINGSTISRNTRAGISNTGQGFPVNQTSIDSTEIADNGRVGIRCSNCGSLGMSYVFIHDNGLTAADALGGISFSMSQRSGVAASGVGIISSTISGNRSTVAGGGLGVTPVLVEDGGATAHTGLDRVTFEANQSASHGGALAVGVGSLRFYKGTLRANTAGGAGGGFAFLTAGLADVSMDSTEIQNNTAGGDGGGAFVARTSRFTAATPSWGYADWISGNTAGGNGGGISVGSAVEMLFEGEGVSRNSAGRDGGGVYVGQTPSLTVDRTVLNGNKAAGSGGGLTVGASSRIVLVDAAARGNTAKNGAGLNVVSNALTVDRTTIATNQATAAGGGARVAGRDAKFVNSTFSGNTAVTGGGLNFTQATAVSLTHVTMADDKAATGAHIAAVRTAKVAISRSAVVLPITGKSCAGIGGGFAGVSGGFSVLRDKTCGKVASDLVTAASPLLAPLGAGPTRVPAPTSPLGGRVPLVRCSTTEDQTSQPRPQGARCDAGSVEFVEAGSSRGTPG